MNVEWKNNTQLQTAIIVMLSYILCINLFENQQFYIFILMFILVCSNYLDSSFFFISIIIIKHQNNKIHIYI